MAKGYINKPKGLGTDNMSCIIVKFNPGMEQDAVENPEGVDQERAEDWTDIYEREVWSPLPEPEGTEEEQKAELDRIQSQAIENAILNMTGSGGTVKSGVFGFKRNPEEEAKRKAEAEERAAKKAAEAEEKTK